jgi:hypothetical protein
MPLDDGMHHGGGGGGDGGDEHNEERMEGVVQTIMMSITVNCALNNLCSLCVGTSLMATMFEQLLTTDPQAAEYVLAQLKEAAIAEKIKHKEENDGR